MLEKAMFGTLGPLEILLIFVVIVLLFGAKKLPEIGKGMGKAITNFKRSMKDPEAVQDNTEKDKKEE
jgi:sec-independent protein translocase protein TatA